MKLSVAIFTGDQDDGQSLRSLLGSHFNGAVEIVQNDPDAALRPLTHSNLIIFGRDVKRQAVFRILRALRIVRAEIPTLLLVNHREPVDQTLEFLSYGIRAVILDEDRENDLHIGIEQALSDRQYASPRMILPMLERYRQLCAELRDSARRGGSNAVTRQN